MQKGVDGAPLPRRKKSSKRAKAGSPKRTDAEANRELVVDAWRKIFSETKRRPTNGAIAKETGLSLNCIQRHTSDPRFDPLAFIRKSSYKTAVEWVIDRQLEKIVLGELDGFSASDVRLFLEIVIAYRAPDAATAPKDDGPEVVITFPDNGRTPGQAVTDPTDIDIDDAPDDGEDQEDD